MSPKIGRNEPCWCGSGSKYKKCHAAADEAASLARSRELAEARRDIALDEGAPPGVTIRKNPESAESSASPNDAAFTLAWGGADVERQLSLLTEGIGGEASISADLIFDAFGSVVESLREAARTRDLDAIIALIKSRRADCVDLDGAYYDIALIENALLRDEDVDELFESAAFEITLDPDGPGLIELLAFRGGGALLQRVMPGVLASILEQGDDDDEGDETAPADPAEEDDDDHLARTSDLAFLVGDLLIAQALAEDPEVVERPEALRETLSAFLEIDEQWFLRVLRAAAGLSALPDEREVSSDDDDQRTDAIVLTTHLFARWLRARVDWPASRHVLARIALCDALLLHTSNLRHPSRRALLLPASTVLGYADDAAHPAESVALLTVSAWWNAWLTELGWVDEISASRELRLLRREWPTIIGAVGTSGGDPAVSALLKGFWSGFPTVYLDPKGSIPPPGR